MNIREFCEDLSIQSAFWVDDDHAGIAELDISHLMATFATEIFDSNRSIGPQVRKLFLESMPNNETKRSVGNAFRLLPTEESDGDIEGFEAQVSILLESVDNPTHLLTESMNIIDGGITNSSSLDAIDNYISTGGPFEKMSFKGWQESYSSLLDDINGENRYLILLDLHNTKERDLSSDVGKEILADLASHEKSDNLLILVLTSICVASDEFKFGKKLTDEHYPEASLPIFAISKQRDWEHKTEATFQEIFLRTALVDSYSRLKLELTKEYKKSIDSVFNKLRPITIEELVLGVAAKSESEGISEIKSLLRIIDHQTKCSFDYNVKDNDELLNLIFRCRKLDTKLIPREEVDRSALEEFHLSENYEDIEAVNALHDQIAVGDIFSVEEQDVDKVDLYILIGNICNTSLRGNSGERKDKVALTFPLGLNPGHENSMKVGLSAGMVIPELAEEIDLYVDFTQPTTFSYERLDLCWTNRGAVAEFNFNDGLEGLLSSGFLTRAQRLRIKKIAEKNPDQSSNIKRVGRVSRNLGTSILHHYSRTLSSIPTDVVF